MYYEHGMNGNSHKTPSSDLDFGLNVFCKHVEKKWEFGFSSQELALRWFEGYIEQLQTLGFYLNVYEVPSENCVISKSGLQLMFKKPC